MARASGDVEKSNYYDRIGEDALRPFWLAPDSPLEPFGRARPFLWPWKVLRPHLMESCEHLPYSDQGTDRRALTMANPSLREVATTSTLAAAMQLILPGEFGPSHRHTPDALRFIVEGDRAYTIVEGEPFTMEPGDLVLTPNWTWHGHLHEGSVPTVWLGILDVPFIKALDLDFYEEFAKPRRLEPMVSDPDASVGRYGASALLANPITASSNRYSPLMSYKFSDVKKALDRLTDFEPDPFEGFVVHYANPMTGGPIMPTIGASLHLIGRGTRTKARRSTANVIYHVASGSGSSVIDGERFDWESGDTFCVPIWCWQEHTATGNDAILFAATDRPLLEALALYREEEFADSAGHQTVRAATNGASPTP